MKAKRSRNLSPAGRGLVFLALICLLLVVLIHLNPGLVRYAYAPYAYWIIQPEEITEETVDGFAGVRRTFTFTIPEGRGFQSDLRFLRKRGAPYRQNPGKLLDYRADPG